MTLLLLFIVGIIFGSFVSALTYRLPRSIPFIKGRSFCPKCKNQIEWLDNIPLVSFILLGGKCRKCGKKISLRYPLIEFAAGLGFVVIWLFFASGFLSLILLLAIFLLLLSIFIIDLEHQIIPDTMVYIGLALVLSYLLLFNRIVIPTSLLSGFIAASLLLLIHLVTKGKGMGLGDVKFAVLGGLIVGLKFMPVWLFLSFLTGGMVGIILIISRKSSLKDKIAFGPFLIIGILLTVIWGERFLTLFL